MERQKVMIFAIKIANMVSELIKRLRSSFSGVSDKRLNPEYKLVDILMSGFAIFHLKDPTLLSFLNLFPIRGSNMQTIYGIEKVPSDTLFRTVLDKVTPSSLAKCFQALMNELRQRGVLDKYKVLGSMGDNFVAVSCDGTSYFCSGSISCPNCLKRVLKNGELQCHHQFLGASLVHPHHKQVFPVFGEGIVKGDGQTKNDCEHNALQRFCPNMEALLFDKIPVVLLDALHSDGVTIKRILGCGMSFISVIKESYVNVQAEALARQNKLEVKVWNKDDSKNKHIRCTAYWASGLILNGSHQDIRVQYVKYEELDTRNNKTVYSNEWITDLEVSDRSIQEFVELAPCRWKIENETWNTLKNHGYNFEHNYGHGKENLSIVFVFLMLMAFFVDQLTLFLDESIQKALKVIKTMRDLRQATRVIFTHVPCQSFEAIYRIIARDSQLKMMEI